MRLTLQLQDGSSQGAFIESTSARIGERVVIAMAAANILAPTPVDRGRSKCSALPAYGVFFSKHPGRLPA